MSLLDMVYASATTQFYFKPAVINDNVYLSGSNIARSPALFAYLLANEKNGIKQEDINIVSIGATNEESEMIDSTVGLYEWMTLLTTLTTSVKLHTMDYMVDNILRSQG